MPDFTGTDLQQQVTNSYIPVALIDPNPRNYKIHPPEKIDRIANSLERFGQPRSVTVQKMAGSDRYMMQAGHSVLAAAKQIGWAQLRCDIIPAEWNPAMVLAFLVAENELRDGSQENDEALASILEEVFRFNPVFTEAAGFTDKELEDIFSQLYPVQSLSPGIPINPGPNGEHNYSVEFLSGGSALQNGSTVLSTSSATAGGDGYSLPTPPPSHVRMVQLFLNAETIVAFTEMLSDLAGRFGTTNTTDTVTEAVKYAHDSLAQPVAG